MKNLLDIKYSQEKTHYMWRRNVSGIHHHWEMSVLHGNAVLHIEGSRKTGYWGHIQLNNEYYAEMESIYSTVDHKIGDGVVNIFCTPDGCAERLIVEWFTIVDGESKLMLKQK